MPSILAQALAAALVCLAACVVPASASSAHRRPGSASGARAVRVIAVSIHGGRTRVTVRWSARVRVVRAGGVRFVVGRRAVRARLVRGRVGRVQVFLLRGARVERVRVALHSVREQRTHRWVPPQTLTAAPPTGTASARSGAPTPLVDPAAMSAISGSRFNSSVGVNVHMSYFDTTYNAWQILRDKLVALGVRNVRDGACVGCVEQRQRLLALGHAGIKVDFIMREPGSPDSVADLVNLVAGPLRSVVASVEGPNEYDASGPGWPARLRAYQSELYRRVRTTPALDGVPVIGPSLTSGDSYPQLGDLSGSLDWGNVHPYPGGRVPLANLASNLTFERQVAGPKPVAATEAGYHNAVATTSGHLPISEAAEAAYVPRLFLDHFLAGVPRTFLYELVDERREDGLRDPEQHFGLLRADYSEKPAFRTLSRLMALTSGAVASPGRVRLSVSGGTDVRRLLLQTGPKTYALVLWRSVSAWDPHTRTMIPVAPTAVRVALGGEFQSAAFSPLNSATALPLSPVAGAVGVELGAMPGVVELRVR